MGRDKGDQKMKGISQLKAKENERVIYTPGTFQLQEIGENYAISKQRVWQIITRCKLGDGEYYVGVDVARNKWSELKKDYTLSKDVKSAFNEWLNEKNIKIAADNKQTAPHTGFDNWW